MLHIPKIGDYLKTLTADKVKGFVVINVDEYFKSSRENKKIVYNMVVIRHFLPWVY